MIVAGTGESVRFPWLLLAGLAAAWAVLAAGCGGGGVFVGTDSATVEVGNGSEAGEDASGHAPVVVEGSAADGLAANPDADGSQVSYLDGAAHEVTFASGPVSRVTRATVRVPRLELVHGPDCAGAAATAVARAHGNLWISPFATTGPAGFDPVPVGARICTVGAAWRATDLVAAVRAAGTLRDGRPFLAAVVAGRTVEADAGGLVARSEGIRLQVRAPVLDWLRQLDWAAVAGAGGTVLVDDDNNPALAAALAGRLAEVQLEVDHVER